MAPPVSSRPTGKPYLRRILFYNTYFVLFHSRNSPYAAEKTLARTFTIPTRPRRRAAAAVTAADSYDEIRSPSSAPPPLVGHRSIGLAERTRTEGQRIATATARAQFLPKNRPTHLHPRAQREALCAPFTERNRIIDRSNRLFSDEEQDHVAAIGDDHDEDEDKPMSGQKTITTTAETPPPPSIIHPPDHHLGGEEGAGLHIVSLRRGLGVCCAPPYVQCV